MKKKVIIIGSGISGLISGVYARKAGFEAEIYESHSIAGGLCTGWQRKGYNIDGCIHWVTGTKKGSDLYQIWETSGVLHENTIVYHKYITCLKQGEQYYYLYSQLKEMEAELIHISPEDTHKIKEMVNTIKVYQKLPMPANKPDELMGFFEKIKYYAPFIKEGKHISRYGKISALDYISEFKSPIIKQLLTAVVPTQLTAHAFFYTWATFTTNDGGWPIGGSLEFAQRIKQKFEDLGGVVHLGSRVEQIVIENNKAIGVKLKNKDNIIPADYIVPATDAKILLDYLLGGKYNDKYFDVRLNNPQKYNILSSTIISLGINTDMSNRPYSLLTAIDTPININRSNFTELTITHYGYDKGITPEGKAIIEVFLIDTEFDYWENLKQTSLKEYNAEKQRVATSIVTEVEKVYPEIKGKIEMIDVATPLTIHRYCGTYRGSYNSFVTSPKTKLENHKGVIKGIKNMYLAGQWVLPQGGLPIAAIAGKFAIQRICKCEGLSIEL